MDNLDQKKSHIATLIKMAKADNDVASIEMGMIRMVALRMGIDANMFNDIEKNVDNIQFSMPMSQEDRLVQLTQILNLVKIDLVTDPDEIKMIKELCAKFGISESKTTELLDYVKSNNVVNYENVKSILG